MPRPNTGPRLKWLDKRGKFYIVWYEFGRERLKATGTRYIGEAEEALEDFIRARRASAQPAGPCDPRTFPISEALDLYGRIHAPEKADPVRIGCAIAALLPFWGDSMVGDITDATCRRYARERGRAPATVRRELGTLKAAVNFAYRQGYITHPKAVWMPPKPDGKDRWLTRHEAARLLNQARTSRADTRLYLPLFIVLGLYTGARKDAILSLRWPQVDFERERINFADGIRTNKQRAHIPIPRRLMTFLRLAYKRRAGDLGFVVHDKGRRIKDIGDSRSGSFGRTCAKAGLTDVTPHTLRRTCGTWLAQGGTSLFDIGQWLGHTDAKTTALYAIHSPDFQERARNVLDRRR